MKRLQEDCSGFTLVELMVVVLILGILVAIAVPVFMASKDSAQSKTCFANQRVIEGAAQTYQAQKGSLPAAGPVNGSHVLITAGYIKTSPRCPLSYQNYSIDASGNVTLASLAACGHPHY